MPSEILTLEWRQVDLQAGTITLDPGTTKNDEPRTFVFKWIDEKQRVQWLDELRDLLRDQRVVTDAIQKQSGKIVRTVFHRNGKPIRSFYTAWENACTAAGCPDRIPHDFRRTAVRNLVRAGVPEAVAMKLTGHKTRSVFERYNVTSVSDLHDAARRLNEAFRSTTQPGAADRAG